MDCRKGPALLSWHDHACPALDGLAGRQGLGVSGIDHQSDHVHGLAIARASRKTTSAANTLLSTLNSRSANILLARNSSWAAGGGRNSRNCIGVHRHYHFR